MIGILPTLAEGHMGLGSLSANPRYKLLSEQILNARGEDITIAIDGAERLRTTSDSIVPEAACTSTQFHVQTSPDQFAAYWNASQAMAGRAGGGRAPTRRTSWARSCGARPGSRSSSRPPTPAARS